MKEIPLAQKRLFIIDAMAMAFRSFYAFGSNQLTTAAGMPTSAVYGSAMFMNKLIAEERPDYLVVAADSSEPTFRHEMYDLYKANRSDMPEDLAVQIDSFFQLMRGYGAPVIKTSGLEADDLIGTLVKKYAGDDVKAFIVSGDKDFMQLIDDNVCMYTPKKAERAVIVDLEAVKKKFGCLPMQVIDCLALIGDSVDNVPGVPGIGEKGAGKLVCSYGNLEGIYENIEQIKNKRQRSGLEASKELAFLSRQLVTIKTDCEIDLTLADMRCQPDEATANEQLATLFEELEFAGLYRRTAEILKQRHAAASNKTKVSGTEPGKAAPKESGVLGSQELAEETAPMTIKVSDYHLVTTTKAMDDLLDRLSKAKQFCFDTETTGLNIISDHPVGISFAVQKGQAYYIPLFEPHLSGGDLTLQDALQKLRKFFADNTAIKIAHNTKFDLQMLENLAIKVPGPWADTMIIDWLLDPISRSHGLDACCLRHLHYEKIKTSTLIGEKGQTPITEAGLPELTTYACEDADLTLRLYETLEPRLASENLTEVLHELEMPLVGVLAQMERHGVFIDHDVLLNFSAQLADLQQEHEEAIFREAGENFNINSPKQLQNILFDKLKVHEKLGITRLKKTKTGFSTDESVLSRLADHPLPRHILDYRTVTKLKNTYVDTLPQLINPKSGRIHASFHQTGTATGRLSSSEPNLQNIPIRTELGQQIRRAFRASRPDLRIIAADYSQVELRLLAHLAEEEILAESFRQGADIHASTGAKIFGVAEDQVDGTMRSRAKAINFGIIYGMGPRRLAADTGVTMSEASDFIERYFASFPGIKEFIRRSIDEARQRGYATTITGRRRPIPALTTGNQRDVANAENIAVNTPIQGSAADLIKLAMAHINQQVHGQRLAVRLIMQVHDELVFECPATEVKIASDLIKKAMEEAMFLTVPLKVQLGVGKDWLEAH